MYLGGIFHLEDSSARMSPGEGRRCLRLIDCCWLRWEAAVDQEEEGRCWWRGG